MPEPPTEESHHLSLVTAFLRGRRGAVGDPAASLRAEAELDLHRFKRTAGLARVDRVLGVLRGLHPRSLLDVGSGRGTFLWPLLEALPETDVVAVDRQPEVVADLAALRRGGIHRLRPARMDVCHLALPDRAVDVVTILEVLEHLPDPGPAAAETVRVARQFVVASVPSQPDTNPEHRHLFSVRALEALFEVAGARRVQVDHVLNHRIAVIRVA